MMKQGINVELVVAFLRAKRMRVGRENMKKIGLAVFADTHASCRANAIASLARPTPVAGIPSRVLDDPAVRVKQHPPNLARAR